MRILYSCDPDGGLRGGYAPVLRHGVSIATVLLIQALLFAGFCEMASAATIVIKGAETETQLLDNGDRLIVTRKGVLDTDGDGVRNAGASVVIRGIKNAGTIATAGDGIFIGDQSQVKGSITNVGNINAGGFGINVQNLGTTVGRIHNGRHGRIDAEEDGIQLVGTCVRRLDNDGTIVARNPIALYGSNACVEGTIRNRGTLEAVDNGIYVISGEAGGIVNTGQISGAEVGIQAYGGRIANEIVNKGSINNCGTGIFVKHTARPGVRNGGRIDAEYYAIVSDRGAGRGVIESVINEKHGVIQAGYGISATIEEQGSLVNAGSIHASGDGIWMSPLGWASLVNSGVVVASGTAIGLSPGYALPAEGTSVELINRGVLLGGVLIFVEADFINSGVVDVGLGFALMSHWHQRPKGVFALTLDDATATYRALVKGDAWIDGDLLVSVEPAFALAAGRRFTLFEIGGTRTGYFANLAQSDIVARHGDVDLRIDYTAEGDIELYATDALDD